MAYLRSQVPTQLALQPVMSYIGAKWSIKQRGGAGTLSHVASDRDRVSRRDGQIF